MQTLIKPLNYNRTSTEFHKYYREFLRNHDNLINQKKNDSNTDYPRSLRLLRIRLRQIIGLEFRFNTKYSLVKSKIVERAYKAVHTGGGPPNITYGCCPNFRLKNGDPYTIEDVIAKYPKLRMTTSRE